MSVTIAKWTLDEYHRMIEVGLLDDRQVELLNGEIVEMSPEGEPHAYFSHEAAKYLGRLLGDRADIRQGKPITIPTSTSEPEPDLAIVQVLGREYLQHHPYPENIFWLIESSNASLSKDTSAKRKAYAAANIREYWIMDLKHYQLRVFRDPANGDYQSELILTTGTISPLAFPGIEISVQQLLER
ncbi:MAG: Uma2 family endonuclease [Leptolyngbyaceae cyanobacterium SL_5_9]|nr:Uma2 family endonuclease [Leptolyngbyaceae cyanobacterium SL_5_9]NJO75269.1 Uma2 family endonuclease [Leptolyngbyaceae cyanobacterium RM1_406_9]